MVAVRAGLLLFNPSKVPSPTTNGTENTVYTKVTAAKKR
jgi:hypothetical protein